MLLGAIADDLTGATDLAIMLARGGMRTVQVVGVPSARDAERLSRFDAVVVALKSRTIAASDAIVQTLASADVLREAGAHQLFFKYCSTFDSTDSGNIGPVCEALLDFLETPVTLACPAFPANGRTVYQGHLFVGEKPLNESAMRNHPLTPMRDANLVRVLKRQSQGEVALVPHRTVDAGPAAIREALRDAAANGVRMVIVDALNDRHLLDIGHAAEGMALVTGGRRGGDGPAGEFHPRRTARSGARPQAPRGPARTRRDPCGELLADDTRAGRRGSGSRLPGDGDRCQ